MTSLGFQFVNVIFRIAANLVVMFRRFPRHVVDWPWFGAMLTPLFMLISSADVSAPWVFIFLMIAPHLSPIQLPRRRFSSAETLRWRVLHSDAGLGNSPKSLNVPWNLLNL
jgi:hypothetical protein